jgi:multidrug efflux pump
VAQVPGITLYMQPVQDLTVEDRISRTQYQYALDAPDKAVLDLWIPRLVDRLKQIPELRDVATDQQNGGSAAGGYRPRYGRPARHHAAERRRHAVRRLRQRQVSTIFTQSNQYHVILEAGPKWQQSAQALKDLSIQIGSASQNLASTVALAGTNTALTGAAVPAAGAARPRSRRR